MARARVFTDCARDNLVRRLVGTEFLRELSIAKELETLDYLLAEAFQHATDALAPNSRDAFGMPCLITAEHRELFTQALSAKLTEVVDKLDSFVTGVSDFARPIRELAESHLPAALLREGTRFCYRTYAELLGKHLAAG